MRAQRFQALLCAAVYLGVFSTPCPEPGFEISAPPHEHAHSVESSPREAETVEPLAVPRASEESESHGHHAHAHDHHHHDHDHGFAVAPTPPEPEPSELVAAHHFLEAQCTCGCDDRPSVAGLSLVGGHPLASSPPIWTPPSADTELDAATPARYQDLSSRIDHVPIHA